MGNFSISTYSHANTQQFSNMTAVSINNLIQVHVGTLLAMPQVMICRIL